MFVPYKERNEIKRLKDFLFLTTFFLTELPPYLFELTIKLGFTNSTGNLFVITVNLL